MTNDKLNRVVSGLVAAYHYLTAGESPVELNEMVECIGEAVDMLNGFPEWVSVHEHKPYAEFGESDSVLCCTECGLQIVLYFDGSNWCYPSGEPYVTRNYETGWRDEVVAWMPLPLAWKGEEK